MLARVGLLALGLTGGPVTLMRSSDFSRGFGAGEGVARSGFFSTGGRSVLYLRTCGGATGSLTGFGFGTSGFLIG